MYPIKKKICTVSVSRHQKKVTQRATSAKNVQSADLRGILKQNKKVTRTKSKKKICWEQNQKYHILLMDKGLLTLNYIWFVLTKKKLYMIFSQTL